MHSWHSDQACGSCKDHCYSSLLSMLLCGQQTSVSEDQALYASLRFIGREETAAHQQHFHTS